jgi:nitrilase
VEGFLVKLARFVETAKRGGAELVVFPELFSGDLLSTGGLNAPAVSIFEERRQWTSIIREHGSQLVQGFDAISRQQNVSVVFGSLPRERNGGIVNTSWLFFADGRSVAQDKLYLTPCEARIWEWKNGEELKVFQAPWGKTSILICHDVEVPELSHRLVSEKPELLLVPSCTSSVRGLRRVRFTAQARAIEHHCYIVQTGTVTGAVSVSNTPNMNEHTGQGSILGPSEEGFEVFPIEGTLNAAELVFGELDFERLRQSRQKGVVYPARDQDVRASEGRSHVRVVIAD